MLFLLVVKAALHKTDSTTVVGKDTSGIFLLCLSCSPTAEIEVHEPDAQGNYPGGSSGEVRVVGDRDLQVGDQVTWFYPCTEWESPRPCTCL